MVKMRLKRVGRKDQSSFRICVMDSRKPRDGDAIEVIGSYNPRLPDDHPERLVLEEQRIRHWLSVGAQPSDTVASFIRNAGINIPFEERQSTGKKASGTDRPTSTPTRSKETPEPAEEEKDIEEKVQEKMSQLSRAERKKAKGN